MLGDGAVAVHPSDERYAPIVGQLCEIPVGPKEHRRLIPIITDEYPDPDFGSGAVKITGAHDFNDYEVAKRGSIPMYRLMDTKGAMRDDGAPYAEAAEIALAVARGETELSEAEADALNLVPDDLRGLDRFAARDQVVKQITGEGLAVMTTADDPDTAPPSEAIPGRNKRKQFEVWEDPDGEYYVFESVQDFADTIQAKYPGKQISNDENLFGDQSFYDPTSGEGIVAVRKAYPKVEAKPIMKPYGDRSKVVIEPMLTDQWFVDTDQIVGPALDAVRDGTIKIMPESGEKTYFHWLENIEPWCISRQLWWGHQVPVWYGPAVGVDGEPERPELYQGFRKPLEQFCAASVDEAIAKAARFYGVEDTGDVVLVENPATATSWLLREEEAGKARPIWRDPDVLDTWFSSGLWPIGTLGWPNWDESTSKYFPTDVLITGQDILFFWVARMIMMQLAVVDEIPFHTVYLHQLVRDEKGKKMSKTTGNVIDPLEIVDEFGADALRFTNASMAAIGGVLKLSTDRIKGYRNFGTKLWNAARFAEMNGAFENVQNGFGGSANHPQNAKNSANAWIIGEVGRARAMVDDALTAYRFNDAANGLYAFVWGTVCDWYLELSKPLFSSEDTEIVDETRATMAWVIDQCLILLHPFMPFVTEELWGNLCDRPNLLVLEPWPEYQPADLIDKNADAEMSWVIALIEEIRSIRGEMGVPAGAKIPLLIQELDDAGRAALTANQPIIERLARLENITHGDAPKGSVTVAVRGGTMALPLADVIDIAAEKTRLEKTATKLAKEIGGLSGRLSNPKFVDSAPEEVVEETRNNLQLRSEEATKISQALQRLEAME
jgi:valyl-tRNA synthetase